MFFFKRVVIYIPVFGMKNVHGDGGILTFFGMGEQSFKSTPFPQNVENFLFPAVAVFS